MSRGGVFEGGIYDSCRCWVGGDDEGLVGLCFGVETVSGWHTWSC